MPIQDQDQSLNGLLAAPTVPLTRQDPGNPTVEESTPLQTWKANLEVNNWVGSLATNGLPDKKADDPNFSAWDEIKGTKYEPFWQDFIYSDNSQEVNDKKSYLDNQIEQRQVLSNASSLDTILSGFGAGILDPLNLIPVANAYKAGKLANAAYGAVKGAGTIGALSAGNEALLDMSQPDRKISENVANTLAGAALGGIVGAAASAAFAPKSYDNLSSIIKTGEPDFTQLPKSTDEGLGVSTVGAKEVIPENIQAEGLNDNVIKYSQIPGLHSPSLDGITSSSNAVRGMTAELFDIPFALKQNSEGISMGPSVESNIRYDRISTMDTVKSMDASYLRYLNVEPGAFSGTRAAIEARSSGKISRQEFNQEIAYAMRRGDKSDIREVEAAAKVSRESIDKINRRLQELELLPEKLEMKTQGTYFPRVYKVQDIMKNRSDFEKNIRDGYMEEHQLSHDEASLRAREITDDILGIGDKDIGLSDISRLSIDKGVRFTKERTLDISDKYLEKYLLNDAGAVTHLYLNQANQMIRVQEFLNKNGVKSPNEIPQILKSEYEQKVAEAEKTISNADKLEKMKTKLGQELKKNTDMISDFVKVMNGQYFQKSKYDTSLRLLNSYNYANMMGYVTISSLSDMAMPVLRNGLGKTLVDGYVAMARETAAGLKGLKNQDLRDLGVSLESEMDNSIRFMMDQGFEDPHIRGKAEQVGDISGNVMSHVSGIHYWNTVHRQLNGRIIEAKLLRTMQKATTVDGDKVSVSFDALSKKDKSTLAELGIDENSATRIMRQQSKYGFEKDGTHFSNSAQWSDQDARRVFSTAITRELNSTILTPGKGDIPLIIQKSQLAKSLFQFKGFMAASTSRVLLSGMSRRDANVVEGMIGLVALGSLSYIVRSALAGKEINYDASNLIVEGINRSGVAGLLSDPIFAFILNPMLRKAGYWGSEGTRYTNQNPVEYIFGPSSSLIKSIYSIGLDAGEGKADDKTLNRMGNLIPYHNVFWFKALMDKLNK